MLPKSNLYSDLSDFQEELVEEKCEITSSEKERDEKTSLCRSRTNFDNFSGQNNGKPTSQNVSKRQ